MKTYGWVLTIGLAGCARCGEDPRCDDEPDSCVAADEAATKGPTAGMDGETTDDAESSSDGAVTDPSTSTGEIPGQCHGNADCAEGESCVAPYGDNVRGPFDCVSECVGPMDEAHWCYDDDACCNAAAHCTIRGYCEVEAGTTTEDGTTTDDGGGSSSSSSTG